MRIDIRPPSKVKSIVARCHLSLKAPPGQSQICDTVLSFSPIWRPGYTWPPAERLAENKLRLSLRVHSNGDIEHFSTEKVFTSLHYEAIPEHGMLRPNDLITPRNGFAMPYRVFVSHFTEVLDRLGMLLEARETFMHKHMSTFCAHRNIAYRLMSPYEISEITSLAVEAENCVFTRLFLVFRGLSDQEMCMYSRSGETEANAMNWRQHIGWSELYRDLTKFQVVETSILEVV